jgi:5'-nucleotidase
VARGIVERLSRAPFGAPVLLNVNVPDLPYEALKGIEVTRLGRRHKAQPVVPGKNPARKKRSTGWGAAGAAREAGPGTDFHALEHGSVSVTPLQVDLTHASQIPLVAEWIGK